MSDEYYVYITASKNNSTLYIGYTHDLAKRIYEHKNHVVKGFTDRYNCVKLVYYEYGGSKEGARSREAQLKKRRREKKEALINSINPEWQDLSTSLGIEE